MNAYEQEIIQATLHSQGELINKQANRIAELEHCLIVEQEHNEMLEKELAVVKQLHDAISLASKPPSKQLSDELIEKVRVTIMGTAYWCADENMPEAYNAVKVCCSEVLEIIKEMNK